MFSLWMRSLIRFVPLSLATSLRSIWVLMDVSLRSSSVYKFFHFITSYLGGLFMRQAFRRYAFPIMIIAAVLAAALPLNCFAVDISTISVVNDFSFTSLASESWSYYYQLANGAVMNSYFDPNRTVSFLNVDGYGVSRDLSLSCMSRQTSLYFSASSSSRDRSFKFELPLFLHDICSLDFDFYFGCFGSTGSLLNFTLDSVILHTSSASIDIPFSLSNDHFSIGPPSNTTWPAGDINYYNLSYNSSSFFDALYLTFSYSITIPSSSSQFYTYHNFALGSNSTFSTLSSNVNSIIQSQSILAQLLDTVIAQQSSSNAEVIDYLDQILVAVESGGSGSDPGTGEGENILQEGVIKQEQLEDLGDALSNVPKPSIENITQSFDPADTLITADPGMVQNALSIVYSWDKFLILLGLFIAVGTISYIIFGKKS